MNPCLLTLPGHQMQRLAGPVSVRTESGLLWITVDGQPEDILLGAGECRRFGPDARVIAYALGGEARCQVWPQAAPNGRRTAMGARGWASRLAAWLRLARPAIGGSA
jgi:hypothetical protein